MPSLSEIRSNPPVARAETHLPVCLDGSLVAKMGALQAELGELLGDITSGPLPARVKVQAARLRDEAADLKGDLDAQSGTLTVRATPTSGEWRLFVDANPPRDKGAPGHDRDKRVGGGFVNVDALLDTLDTYAAEWDGEPMAPGDWDRISPAIHPGDLLTIAAAVVSLYEAPSDFALRRSALSATHSGLSDFAEPETSDSPTSDSTAGSPSEPSAATTAPANE